VALLFNAQTAVDQVSATVVVEQEVTVVASGSWPWGTVVSVEGRATGSTGAWVPVEVDVRSPGPHNIRLNKMDIRFRTRAMPTGASVSLEVAD
jgi:phage tail sheath gpL-like